MPGLNNFDPSGDPFLAPISLAAATLDWDAAVDNLCLDITTSSCVLQPGGSEFLHLRWTVRDALSGAAITLTGNDDVTTVEMAVVSDEPASTDWVTAGLVTRAAGTPADGEYSVIKIGLGTAVVLTPNPYRVYGRLTTAGEIIERLAPTTLTIEG